MSKAVMLIAASFAMLAALLVLEFLLLPHKYHYLGVFLVFLLLDMILVCRYVTVFIDLFQAAMIFFAVTIVFCISVLPQIREEPNIDPWWRRIRSWFDTRVIDPCLDFGHALACWTGLYWVVPAFAAEMSDLIGSTRHQWRQHIYEGPPSIVCGVNIAPTRIVVRDIRSGCVSSLAWVVRKLLAALR